MRYWNDITKYYLFRSLNKRLALPVWFLFMLDQGLTIQQIALIGAISTAVGFLLEVPSGAIADTIGHKRALILSMLGQGTGVLLFIGGSFEWILAGSLVYWGVGTLMTGTHQAFFFERLTMEGRQHDYQQLMGRARSISSTFSAITVSFVGVLYVWNPSLPFLIGALLFWMGSLVAATFSPTVESVSVATREGYSTWIRHLKHGLNTITQHRALLWMMGIEALIYGVMIASTEMQQLVLENVGLAAVLFGILYTIKRLFSAILAPLVHRWHTTLTPQRTLTTMLICVSIYLILMGIVQHPLLLFPIVLFGSATIVLVDIPMSHHKNTLIPSGSRATTLSMGNFLGAVMKMITLGGFGWLAIHLPIQHTHLVLGMITLIMGTTLLYFGGKHLSQTT